MRGRKGTLQSPAMPVPWALLPSFRTGGTTHTPMATRFLYKIVSHSALKAKIRDPVSAEGSMGPCPNLPCSLCYTFTRTHAHTPKEGECPPHASRARKINKPAFIHGLPPAAHQALPGETAPVPSSPSPGQAWGAGPPLPSRGTICGYLRLSTRVGGRPGGNPPHFPEHLQWLSAG